MRTTQLRKPYHERVELDVWARVANHLSMFLHPEPALSDRVMISRALARRRIFVTPPLPRP